MIQKDRGNTQKIYAEHRGIATEKRNIIAMKAISRIVDIVVETGTSNATCEFEPFSFFVEEYDAALRCRFRKVGLCT